MSDHPSSDSPELGDRLAAVREELTSRLPRPDGRLDALLTGGSASDAPSPLRPPPDIVVEEIVELDPVRRRRARVGAALAVAATLTLLAGAGALALRSDNTPDGDSLVGPAAELPEAEGDTDAPSEPEAEQPADEDKFFDDEFFEGAFAEHGEWLGCITGEFERFLDERPPTPFSTTACGDFPPIPELDLDLDLDLELGPELDDWFACLETGPHDKEKPCIAGGVEIFPFGGFDPGDFDEICEKTTEEGGFSLMCTWPPCEGDDCFPKLCDEDPVGDEECLAFGLDFGFGLEIPWGPHAWPDWPKGDRPNEVPDPGSNEDEDAAA